MIEKDSARIELWEFEDLSNEWAIKIKNHFAFASDDIEADLRKYLDAGYEIAIDLTQTTDPKNVIRKYAYIKDAMGNFIELCEPVS